VRAIDRGRWQPGTDATDERRCPYDGACAGGTLTDARYDRDNSATCTSGRGLAGAFCELCESRDQYFAPASERCHYCREARLALLAASLSLLGVIVLALVGWAAVKRRRAALARRLAAYARRVALGNKLWECVSFYQILSQFEAVYDLALPPGGAGVVDRTVITVANALPLARLQV